MTKSKLNIPQNKIAAFCKKNGIRKLSLFGSALLDNMRPDSDMDFLVEFGPGRIPGLLGLAGMEIELTNIVKRKVDLRTPQDLSRYFRKDVMKSAKVQYAE